jgi:hypothetical protein
MTARPGSGCGTTGAGPGLSNSGGAPGARAPRGGFGTETDWIWDGDNWDWFGPGNTWWVTVEQDSVYRYSFWSPATGDAYFGALIQDETHHRVGDMFWTAEGVYRIEAEQPLGRRHAEPWGTVWVDAYYDSGSGRWLWNASRDSGAPVGRAWLGSEADWVWDGDSWDWFGGGHTWWANVE